MSTTMPKAQNITRKWYVIDAADKPLGRTAAKAADLLRGKHKPIFAPHVDCGDHVIIINAEKAVLTGKKLTQKVHYHMMLAVKGMIPDTTIGRQALTRCRIYKGSEHNHAAQKPEQL